MVYAEAAFFDGAHVQHIADYLEAKRFQRVTRIAERGVVANVARERRQAESTFIFGDRRIPD